MLVNLPPRQKKKPFREAEGLFSFKALQIYLHKRMNEKSP
jgi:hypothetical protein